MRLALSNEALNISGRSNWPQIETNRSAISSVSDSLSITQGPATTNSGCPEPQVMFSKATGFNGTTIIGWTAYSSYYPGSPLIKSRIKVLASSAERRSSSDQGSHLFSTANSLPGRRPTHKEFVDRSQLSVL